ncbi:MAG: NAD(+) synthase [Planctomycetes bacterium]|nr:NAD(+) synthase [Planctomycetota bacterium]
MPNYREFDDSRHFYDTRKCALEREQKVEELINPHTFINRQGKDVVCGGLLCEDGWSDDYSFHPQNILAQKGAELIINLSCSPFTLGKKNKRSRVFEKQARELNTPILYCNCVGTQNNGKTLYTFDGDSCLYSPTQGRMMNLKPFEECLHTISLNESNPHIDQELSTSQYTLEAVLYGTRKFLEMTGIKKVVIGVSGGIDSALAAAIYSRILEPSNLLLVNMPSRFNSKLTKNAAEELAQNLGCCYTIASIQECFENTVNQLENISINNYSLGSQPEATFNLDISSFVKENIQARDRSSRLLAAIAAAFGGAFTCNANKSETTVGYSTLYGDHAGLLANLADLWKGQVYEMSHEINNQAGKKIIPQSIIDIKPSAELSDQQNPEKGQGDPFHYPYHDALFRSWVEDWNRKSPEEILQWRLEGSLEKQLGLSHNLTKQLFPTHKEFIADLERWWKCYCGLGLAKRIQAPPILAISRRVFGFDHREAQCPVLWTQKYLALKEEALK